MRVIVYNNAVMNKNTYINGNASSTKATEATITNLNPAVTHESNGKSNKEVIEFVINNGIFSDMIIKIKNELAEFTADAAATYLDHYGYEFVSNEVYKIALKYFADFENIKYSIDNDTYGLFADEMVMTEVVDLSEYDDLSEFNEIAGVSFTQFFNLNKMTVTNFLGLVEDWNEIVVEKLDDNDESKMLHRASMTRLANLMIG